MGRNVLAIFAHPDDPDFSCAGTVAKWIADGDEVRYVSCTSGDKGSSELGINPAELSLTRERGQEAAAKELGVTGCTFLRHKDGELEVTRAFRAEIAQLLRQFKPDAVVTHDPWQHYQIHPDHRAVGQVVVDAVASARDHLYFEYQTLGELNAHRVKDVYLFSPESANLWVDISDTIHRKIAAVSHHKSQIKNTPDVEGRVRQRAAQAGASQGLAFAEAFRHIELR